MIKRRLIPVLYLQHGWMVRSELFTTHQIIGNPVVHVERMAQWNVDELIVLDISHGESSRFEHLRDDYREPGAKDLREFIQKVASECRLPLTFGGGIRNIEDARERILNGADKISLGAMLHSQPDQVTRIAHALGSQAVVASIDYRGSGKEAAVFTDFGKTSIGQSPVEVAQHVANIGAGEILLNAIDRDGTAKGYDTETISRVAGAVNIPVIACGGAGHVRHFHTCFEIEEVSAVAAGNIFHFTENAYPRAKQILRNKRSDIR